MTTEQILYVTDDYETTAAWMEGLEQLCKMNSVTLVRREQVPINNLAQFDLVIIEVHSRAAFKDALETCRQVRAQTSPIILVLAPQNDEESAIRAYEAGANEYISKPVSPALFDAKLKAWRRWAVSAYANS